METAFDRREKAKTRAFMVRLKIVIATYQVILQSPTIFNIKMGPLFQAMINLLSFLNFDVFQIIPLQCLQPFAYIEAMISATLMPVGASGFLFVLYLVQRIHILAVEPNRVIRRDKLKKVGQGAARTQTSKFCNKCHPQNKNCRPDLTHTFTD